MDELATPSSLGLPLGAMSPDISAFGLSAKTIRILCIIFASQPKVLRVWVYGSRAKGNYREGSDIDLTMDAPDLSFSERATLQGAIDESRIPYMVDLSVFHEITHPKLLEHIQGVGQLFYAREVG